MAEQLLFGAAAGMAETGLIPFASTYAVFAARRAYDFLCLDIAEPNLNVNIVGGLPGLTTGYGPSHQASEDIAIFRGMPNLTIVDPCDSLDIEQAVPQLAAADGPTYLRLLRGKVPTVLDEYDYRFELGKAKVLRPGNDVVFVTSGLMTMRALQAADQLAKHRVDAAVLHTPTIKPFDAHTVLAEVDSDRLVVTCENHTVVGGLFETVASAAVRAGSRSRSCPSRCPTNSSPPAPCPPCTSATACPPTASSPASCTTSADRAYGPGSTRRPAVRSTVDSRMSTSIVRTQGGRHDHAARALLGLEKTNLRQQAVDRPAHRHHQRRTAPAQPTDRNRAVRDAADQPGHAARSLAATPAGGPGLRRGAGPAAPCATSTPRRSATSSPCAPRSNTGRARARRAARPRHPRRRPARGARRDGRRRRRPTTGSKPT